MASRSTRDALNNNTAALMNLAAAIDELGSSDLLDSQKELTKTLKWLARETVSGAQVYRDLVPILKEQRKDLQAYSDIGEKQRDSTDGNTSATKESSKAIQHSIRRLFFLDKTLGILNRTIGEFFSVGESTTKATAATNLSFQKIVRSAVNDFSNDIGGFSVNMAANLDLFRAGLGENSQEMRKSVVRAKLTGQSTDALMNAMLILEATTGMGHERTGALINSLTETSLGFHRDLTVLTTTIEALKDNLPEFEFLGLTEEITGAANRLASIEGLGPQFIGPITDLAKKMATFDPETIKSIGLLGVQDLYAKLGEATGETERARIMADIAVKSFRFGEEMKRGAGDNRIAAMVLKGMFSENIMAMMSLGRKLDQTPYADQLNRISEVNNAIPQTFERTLEEFKSSILAPIMRFFPPLVTAVKHLLAPVTIIAGSMVTLMAQNMYGQMVGGLKNVVNTLISTKMGMTYLTTGLGGFRVVLGGLVRFLPMILGIGGLVAGVALAVPALIALFSDSNETSKEGVGYGKKTSDNTKKMADHLVKSSNKSSGHLSLVNSLIDKSFEAMVRRGPQSTIEVEILQDLRTVMEDQSEKLDSIDRKTKELGTGLRDR